MRTRPGGHPTPAATARHPRQEARDGPRPSRPSGPGPAPLHESRKRDGGDRLGAPRARLGVVAGWSTMDPKGTRGCIFWSIVIFVLFLAFVMIVVRPPPFPSVQVLRGL